MRLLNQTCRAVLTSLILAAGINVLMLGVPTYPLPIFDTVVPVGSLERLSVLSVGVATAVAALGVPAIALGGCIGGAFPTLAARPGDLLREGQVLAPLDTSALDGQIATVRAQAEASRRQLAPICQEAATIADLAERELTGRSRVLSLERHVAEMEKDAAACNARIELTDAGAEIPRRVRLHSGMRTETLLVAGERRLLDQLLDPLIRNINRAVRA